MGSPPAGQRRTHRSRKNFTVAGPAGTPCGCARAANCPNRVRFAADSARSRPRGGRGRRPGAGPAARALAARAEERRALALDDAPDRAPARPARLPGAVVDAQLLRERAGLAAGIAVHAERRPHAPDGFAEHARNLARDRAPFRLAQPARGAARIHVRAEQDLARVDVADPGEAPLIEQEVLDADARAARELEQPFGRGWRRDRIRAEIAQRRIAR